MSQNERAKMLKEHRRNTSPEIQKIEALELIADALAGIHSELVKLNFRSK